MSATPATTKLGPDQAHLRATMRRLAEVTSTEAPILSVYVDTRPQAHPERPAERPQLKEASRRLDAIADGLEPHTPARESVDTDRATIERFFDESDLDGVGGIAIFACAHIDLWEVVHSNAEFETAVTAGPTADLVGVARLLDDAVSAIVAVVDSNTCRLFVTRRGDLIERPGPDEDPDEHRRTDVGGWSQARYQRHVDMQDKRFAAEAAQAIERLVERERATHVIIAGDERIVPVLEAELPERVRGLVELTPHIAIRASVDEVREEVAPILAALDEAESMAAADRAVAGHRSGGLGVAGLDATMQALEFGQVDELVLDETASLDEDLRTELVRQAALIDARVELVREHAQLLRFDGVGATLRFRI